MQANRVRARRWIALAGGIALGAAASAQPLHPIPPVLRPLHERAAEAELVVIGAVTRVEPGRLAVSARATLRGAPPERLAVKRSPLRPPALAAGDLALLFLRGARPPYVLAGDPREVLRIPSERDARALAAALPDLLAAGGDVAALRALYARWASSGAPLLRALAAAELAALPPQDEVAARPPPHAR